MTSPAPLNQSLNQKLDEIFRPWNRNEAPGLAVGVAHKGSVIYRSAFGLASIQSGKPNSPAIRMRIGSTSKHMCSLGVMLLAEEGKLDINRPVRDYLPELSNSCGEPTLLQLMHHTGGVRDPMISAFIINGGHYGHLPEGANLDLMSRFTERNFAPGERMAYSNSGYYLLSLVIERVGGQSLEKFLGERLFAPLGMNDSMLLSSDMRMVPNMAALHMPQPDGSWRRGIYPVEQFLGSGAVVSTIDDMLVWTAHLRGPQRKVGSPETWARMFERQNFPSGKQIGYGLGIARNDYRGVEIFHHAGATLGAQSQMLTVPQHELDIVVLANRMDIPAPVLALKVLDTVLGLEPTEVPPAAADFPAVHGRWYSSQSRTLLQISPRKLKPEYPELMLLSLYNAPTAALLRRGEGLALPDGPMSSYEIRKLPVGNKPPATLDVHVTGDLESFERLPENPLTPAQLAPAVIGRYRYVEFGKEVAIVLKDGKLFLDFMPPFGHGRWELEVFSENVLGCGVFHGDPPAPIPQYASLSLERREGKVTGFWFDMDRIRGVRFDRY